MGNAAASAASASPVPSDASGNWHEFGYQSVLCDNYEAGYFLDYIVDAAGNYLEFSTDRDAIGEQCENPEEFRAGGLETITAPSIGHPDRQQPRVYQVEMDENELSISTARRDGNDDPIHWAHFYYDESRELQGQLDRLGTMHAIEYDETPESDPIPVLVSNNDNANLNFYNLVTEFEFDFHTHDSAPGARSVIQEFRQLGPRIYPDVAVTKYCFDAEGNLINVVDPLDRTVLEIEWDTDRNPEVVTNVFGGETIRTFDGVGNVEPIPKPRTLSFSV